MSSTKNFEQLAKLIRYFILTSTTAAGSGHATSSLSATDLMTVLMFGGFLEADLDHPDNPANDRLIFSKGHASPLFYSLYAAAGKVSERELMTLRKFGSSLEGHPTMLFPYTEAATGSLGQGLSIGLGMAINGKYLDNVPYKTFVLLGDSEMAEGSVWEAMQVAAHYNLNNLVAILDVNGLGQRGETMYGHDVSVYAKRAEAFGWETMVIDGHDFKEIETAFKKSINQKNKPTMIVAKTVKGKGVSFLEDKDGWHGRALSDEELEKARAELGEVDAVLRGEVANVKVRSSQFSVRSKLKIQESRVEYKLGERVATRKAYGNALVKLFPEFPKMVVLDAEVSNSTYADIFKKLYPDHFFEMYIAEQNMVGTALGLSRRGKIPFVSTFAAFFSRAYDQIRMSQYSEPNIKFVGSHAGVSIGEDGASQMGLEDIALFRTLLDSVVLYPADAVATEKLVAEAAEHVGNVYLRTTRKETPVIYSVDEDFPIGGSKVLKESAEDVVTVVGAGVTLFEALKAYEELEKEGIKIRIIDLYSVKPLDVATLETVVKETKAIIVVEDHYEAGGIGEAVAGALGERGKGKDATVISLAVRKMPRSGKPEELLKYEEIDAAAIVRKVKEIL